MYQFAGYSPANYSDPLGLERVLNPISSPEAQAIADEYLAAYELFRATPAGAEYHAAINDPNLGYTLFVDFNPNYAGAMVVGQYVFDEAGLALLSSTLTVGPNWNKGSPGKWNYPVASRMLEHNLSDYLEIQRIAHEEAGHAMLPITSCEYFAALLYKEYFNSHLKREQAIAAKLFPEKNYISAAESACQMSLLFGPEPTAMIEEHYASFLERQSEFESLRFLPPKAANRLRKQIEREEKTMLKDKTRRERVRQKKYWKSLRKKGE